MYFWENNYVRALKWAESNKARGGSIKDPAVIGAVIDLNNCFDLLDDHYINLAALSYRLMANEYTSINKRIPVNKDASGDSNRDKVMRFRTALLLNLCMNIAEKKLTSN